MRQLARPVTTFLYELSLEVETPPEDPGTELEAVIRTAPSRPLDALLTMQRFSYQRAAVRQNPVPRYLRSQFSIGSQSQTSTERNGHSVSNQPRKLACAASTTS